MLDTLSANDFTGLVGDNFTLVIMNGPDIEITLEQVKEKPESANPEAGNDVRTPFSLFFKGDACHAVEGGSFDLRHDKFPGDVRGVNVNRVLPPDADNQSAWYQVIFC